MQNLHHIFDCHYIGQIYGGDFAKNCGHLRIYELYLTKSNSKRENFSSVGCASLCSSSEVKLIGVDEFKLMHFHNVFVIKSKDIIKLINLKCIQAPKYLLMKMANKYNKLPFSNNWNTEIYLLKYF